ncbi:MAG TPA: sugar nucleotide-binding protein [Candidatus Limnocylindrales bacterium]|jgi:dTDP-4-dehydrorhamnose reductase|nr:sugar nucleotide-binding protein [Candidatus Limnocylindrales bacterium]
MRVAVTGAGGRLGSALVKILWGSSFVREVLAWDLPEHDLDDPTSAERLIGTFRPDAVVHCAAWTDVDGCARNPDLAMRRNGTAVGEIARTCVSVGAGLVVISTNEVFDGSRTDGLPYSPTEPSNPANPYGASKLEGETAARTAFLATGGDFSAAALAEDGNGQVPPLAIVRTAWLFGRPGIDFPQKILAAAGRARDQHQSLALVSDEIGTPTYAPDLASAIVRLLGEAARPGGRGFGGIHHVVNGGQASRATWAREVLRLAGIDVATNDVPSTTWARPSTPPAWGVLQTTPLPGGPLRDWREALEEHMALPSSHEEAGR